MGGGVARRGAERKKRGEEGKERERDRERGQGGGRGWQWVARGR